MAKLIVDPSPSDANDARHFHLGEEADETEPRPQGTVGGLIDALSKYPPSYGLRFLTDPAGLPLVHISDDSIDAGEMVYVDLLIEGEEEE